MALFSSRYVSPVPLQNHHLGRRPYKTFPDTYAIGCTRR
ncbi:hypothetical protein B4098_0286 [Heyndrickxia coagulans]|uniref:Uncharacterized protein n=1 Tax=Heyndrickxia coagulans TaxID=1398 RepID=A0A150JVQ3_HEYCO|nr:hypothetical protein B4098_0286 [Heyndrickxia coagulans]